MTMFGIPPSIRATMRRSLISYGGDDGKAALEWLEQQPLEGLTPSETEVVKLVAEGMTNREVGKALIMAGKTVQTHLHHVFAKAHVQNRVQLVRWAIRHGIVKLDDETQNGTGDAVSNGAKS